MEETHKLEVHPDVGDLLAPGVIGLPYVWIKVSHHNRFLAPEADQVLL